MKRLFNQLPPNVRDALTGLGYALLITLILLFVYGPVSEFRYLMI